MRNIAKVLFTLFLLTFSVKAQVIAGETPPAPPPDTEMNAEETKENKEKVNEEKKEEKSAFEKAIEGYKKIEGLFTFYFKEDENKYLLEIKPEQLDKVYLCNVFLEAGDGYFFDSGSMLDNFPFYFHKIGKKVQFIQKNVAYRVAKDSSLSKAIERGVSDSILASSNLVGEPHPETQAILIEPNPLFIRDHINLGFELSRMGAGFSFDPSESYFKEVKSFPFNSEIEVVLHFRGSGAEATSPAIPDSRSFQHRYRYSLAVIPESDYKPRLADDRVGHFLTMYQDYTDLTKETAYVRYVNRWNLKKKFPFEELSVPEKPIVFWIENTVPEEYRDAVRDGILEWNKAFERIGFKNAIEVKQMPNDADWDPADIRYNVIQWIVMPGSGYAVGPSWANPYTGELYAADIRLAVDFIRSFAMDWEEMVAPLRNNESAIEADRPLPESLRKFTINQCAYGDGLMREANFALSYLASTGDFDPNSAEGKKFIMDGLKDLVTHEVGHTLGLRHNFKASIIHSLEEVHNRSITDREGISGSVMDYNVVNLALPGQRQGSYWQTTLGTYDYWAIEYAYKEIKSETPEDELFELEKIAKRASEPKLAYGTDEDAWGLDPFVNMWDLSSDPIAYFRHRIKIAKELMNRIESQFEKPGKRYQKLRLVFSNVMAQYSMAASTVPKFIAGMEHNRFHIGDPGEKLPYEPVSSAKQREALKFLEENIFAKDAFNIPPRLLNKLAVERFPVFRVGPPPERRDFPLHNFILSIQTNALYGLYNSYVLNRLLDFPYHLEADETPFTMAEMFSRLRNAIWSEVYARENIDSFRRNLQRAHLRILTNILFNTTSYPEDAVTLAREDLAELSRVIGSAIRTASLDTITRAHLEETLSRIRSALSAEVERRL